MTFEKLKEAREAFGAVQDKYIDFGARDTEPRCTLHALARKTVSKGEVVLPPEGWGDNPWQLYSSVSGYKRANRALTTAAKKFLTALIKAPVSVVKEFDRYYDMGLDW